MHAIGEQQLKRVQSGSSSRSGRDQEQQLKRMQAASMQLKQAQSITGRAAAGSGRKRGAAVEADAIGPGSSSCQLIRSGRKRRAAAEVDAIGEQQLCTESCPAPDYSR